MYQQPYPNIFRPLTIGPVVTKNRIEVAPAVPMLATEEGFVTDTLIAYTQELARSGAGIVTVGDSTVDWVYGHEHLNQLNLGDHRVIPGLYRLVCAIERHGAVASIEINHGGRFTAPMHLNGRSPIGPSAIPSNAAGQFEGDEGRRSVPVHEMDQNEIARVENEFVCAVDHCVQAGFKMVMLHGGHGHLLSEFFSPLSNHRNDHYGGSFENRLRFPMEVLTKIRNRFGRSIAIEYRISADEMVEEGVHFEEITRFVQAIQDKIDLVHVSFGNICEPVTAPYQIQPTYMERGLNVHWAMELKKRVDIPVAAVGSINLDMADQILADDQVDIAAMVRTILADTRAVEKYRRNQADQVRPCIRCGTCTENTSRFYPITCAINPQICREMEFTDILPAATPKRVVVVGGGPAGLEAAYIAELRGHQVTLLEAEDHLGGNLVAASAAGFKQDMRRYLDWLIRQVTRAKGVDVRLSTHATPEMVETMKPDAVLVAIGAEPFIPNIPGKERAILASKIHLGTETGNKVIVVGGGLTGLEAALHLAQEGKDVVVLDMIPTDEFGKDCNGIPKIGLFQLLKKAHVQFVGDINLESIDLHGVTVMDRNWKRRTMEADTVVLATGFRGRVEKAAAFQGCAVDVLNIGDCRRVSNLNQAIHQGFDAAYEL